MLRYLSFRKKKEMGENVKELNKIEDDMKEFNQILNNNVNIVRNQIEIMDHDYTEARKKFELIERDYLEAKLNLISHRKRKELLIRRLCKIIDENEIRKALKLSELMKQREQSVDT